MKSIQALAFLLSAPVLAQGLGDPPVPPGNPLTFEKVQLGKALFWDEQLSSTRTIACGSCHMPEAGGVDPRTFLQPGAAAHPGPDGQFGTGDDILASPGIPRTTVAGDYDLDDVFGLAPRVTPRRAPTMINAAFAPELFWDGRASGTFLDPITGAVVLPSGAALESLVAQPPVNDVEMGHLGRDWNDVVARIVASPPLALSPYVPPALDGWIAGRAYPALYRDAFGTSEVTAARTCMAIASYLRTLVSDETAFDRFLNGDSTAMTQQQKDGLVIFQVARCDTCHVPPTLTSFEFKYTGVRPRNEDLGRFVVSGDPAQRGAMKIPDLRNVGLRAPFFHTGGKQTFDDVIDFYSVGGDFQQGNNDLIAAPIFGSNRVLLLAFLEGALVDPRVRQALPPFDHPELSLGTERVPQEYGAATAGGSGVEPRIHAVEPSRLGANDFTFGISDARGGAKAGLYLSLTQDAQGTPFQGAVLHVGITPGTRFFRVKALLGSGPSDGWGSLDVALPSQSVFSGTSLFGQWVVVDPHAGGPLASTAAVELTLFE